MASGFGDGARLMRASADVLRQDPALLWFPVLSTCCLLLTAGFWIFEGAWLVAVSGPALLFVPLVLVGLYSLTLVGIFFNVAVAGCADDALAGRETSLGDGLDTAWSCLGAVAGWAAYSLFVSFALGLVQSIRGARLLGRAAEVAWSFATLFVVPLIALDGLDAGDARRQSFQLARSRWQTESGGLVALRAALFVPGILFYLVVKLLLNGHDDTLSGQVLLGLVLLVAFALSAAVGVVRQIFAVSLYRRAEPESAAQIA
jgi:Family of unknown function (DUF6159)